ncbi:MAG TPA: radical SAM protein [Candidatus Angelobacter sp.]|nr:radical SAM protein [Candidatus Angelobacter sp.]
MRFPALLTAKIAKARIAQTFRSANQGRLLEYMNAADVLHPGSAHPVSHEKIRDILASRAPILWIGGREPLEHPGIAHLVRALAPTGKYLFLETNGVLLRRRIHEFQPLPRVFLTVCLDARRKTEFDLAVEGLRAARLSGFFTAAHSLVGESDDLVELERLRELLLEWDTDAWLITAESANTAALRKAEQARALVPSAGWRRFSAQVERELLSQAKDSESPEIPLAQKPHPESCAEGVKVA